MDQRGIHDITHFGVISRQLRLDDGLNPLICAQFGSHLDNSK